ncbi:hypothetical protein HCTV5_37 [Halovirus HCTV-5]|uniref:hypothetical protein n=1 Tax=Halovirus HCTV-5 TaxID=1273748 RepID=UPI0003348A17|nr:hypothetical protein M200_gp037 [Halovirus HCTV-5]AGM11647.1 hypothetical protein HCTV5_37 [Halovirus HCTV-5]
MTDVHPPRVSLDLESVLADTHQVYIEELNERYGRRYEYHEVDDWDWVSQEERDFGEFMSIVHHAWEDEWMTIPTCDPEDELLDAIEDLALDYIVDIVTARVGVEHEMRFWLGDKAILPLTSQFRSLHPSKSKANLDYHYFIDDKPQLADNISDEQVQFLVDRPWNQNVEERSNVYRVDSVADAVEVISDSSDL